MKTLLALSLILVTNPAFAKMEAGSYEICKGNARGGVPVTVIGNFTVDTKKEFVVEVNANGERLSYNVEGVEGGDVQENFRSDDHGGLKISFYDQDMSASGWSKQLGAFKLKCTDNK